MLHQIIYTSCRTGITGTGDGLQIFSKDNEFPDIAMPDIEKMFSYTPPRISTLMTSEIAKTMPQSFYFKFLGNNNYAWGLNTYLGHDYMGEGSRFGNFMSHIILSDEKPKNYPAEYYSSSMFRNKMEFEEVNSKEKPAYLENPKEKLGDKINVDTIISFLNEGDRLDIYINMVAAMLDFRNSKKRVLILDEQENIIFWIAALEYAIPLNFAMRIPFNTYEYNPDSSPYRICGVLKEGTNYSNANDSLHYTFNLFDHTYPEFKVNAFLTFLKNSILTNSYDKLVNYHNFLINNYDKYYLANDDIYHIFNLYNNENLSVEELEKIFNLTEKFANENGLNIVIDKALKILSKKDSDISTFLAITDFLSNIKKELKLTDILSPAYKSALLNIYKDNSISFDVFKEYYTKLQQTSMTFNINLEKEILSDELFEELLNSTISNNDFKRINWFYGVFKKWKSSDYFNKEKFSESIFKFFEMRYKYISDYDSQFELFKLLKFYNFYPDITRNLIIDLIEPIKFQKMEGMVLDSLKSIFNYVEGWKYERQIEKLELLYLGLQFQTFNLEKNIELNSPIEISVCENEAKDYFDWIMPYAIQRYQKSEDMIKFYQMLIMSESVLNLFLNMWFDYITKCSQNRNSPLVVECIYFMLNINASYSDELIRKIKKIIGKSKEMERTEKLILARNDNPTVKKRWLELKSKMEDSGILSIAKKWFFKK